METAPAPMIEDVHSVLDVNFQENPYGGIKVTFLFIQSVCNGKQTPFPAHASSVSDVNWQENASSEGRDIVENAHCTSCKVLLVTNQLHPSIQQLWCKSLESQT